MFSDRLLVMYLYFILVQNHTVCTLKTYIVSINNEIIHHHIPCHPATDALDILLPGGYSRICSQYNCNPEYEYQKV